MNSLEFTTLLPDHHFEIFHGLEPCELYHLSFTSKELNRRVLTSAVWDKHLKSDFPYSLETEGTSFQKYTVCKRKSFKNIMTKYRKMFWLIEARHYDEISKHLLKFIPEDLSVHSLELFQRKSFAAIANGKKDRRLQNLFYNFVKEFCQQKRPWENLIPWAISFEQLTLLSDHIPNKQSISTAIFNGALCSLDYFVKTGDDILPQAASLIQRAVELGRIDMLQWTLDRIEWRFSNGPEGNLLYQAALSGHKEMLLFLIQQSLYHPDHIKLALEIAIQRGWPSALEVLLNLLPQTELSIDDLLKQLDFQDNLNETTACLKLLLDKGANIRKFPALFHEARNHEHTTLLMLEHVTDLNYYLTNKKAVEMLLKKGAIVTNDISEKTENNLIDGLNGPDVDQLEAIYNLISENWRLKFWESQNQLPPH